MRVKCFAQEHNTMSPARTRIWTARSGVERTNHEATAPLTICLRGGGLRSESSTLASERSLRAGWGEREEGGGRGRREGGGGIELC